MKKEFETQCLGISPEDTQDEIYVRDQSGKLVKLEVEDDAGNN